MTAVTALDVGSTIRHRIFQSLAPSIRALSIMSLPIFMKNARMTMMLKTLTALGRISAQYWSNPPSAETTRNSGITPPLKNIVVIMNHKIVLWPNDPALDRP
jgi:hypothetical protein